MKREDIKEAAVNYDPRLVVFKAFIKGADWRINSVWHHNLKEAKTRKCVIVRFTNGLFNLFEDIRELKGIEDKIQAFAYIEDLLPTKEDKQ